MRTSLGALLGTVLIGATAVGCVPPAAPAPAPTPTTAPAVTTPPTAPPTAPPTTSAGPHAPQVTSWSASTSAGSSPLTTALSWNVSDPDGDTLTCRLDLDGNGAFELALSPCPATGARTRTYTTLGSTAATIEVSDATATSTAVTTVTVGTASADQFAITLRLGGTMSPGQTAAFVSAATKWASIIKTGQPDRTTSFGADFCATGTAAYSGTIDDLLIDAQIVSIDGAGGILGQAGPCLLRSSNGMPLYGVMQFDSADAAGLEAGGQLTDTIVHEMGHVLGIGTIWSSKGVLSGAGGANPTFTGRAAVGIWQELGGTGDVPVENSGGGGTADSHWRETVFRTELMTGYLNGTNQLSSLSAASLADIGYGVDLAGADTYVLPALRLPWVQAQAEEGTMIRLTPRGSA